MRGRLLTLLVALAALAAMIAVPAAQADPCEGPACFVIDDARTTVTRVGPRRARVDVFYADGAPFVRATFDTARGHSVFWRGVGRATIRYPDGRTLAAGPNPWSGRGTTTYWLADGRLFATVRHTATAGDVVVRLGAAIRRHPAHPPCRGRLTFEGPEWSAVASTKHLVGALRPFRLRCAEGESAYWSFDGEPLPSPVDRSVRGRAAFAVVNRRAAELHTRL